MPLEFRNNITLPFSHVTKTPSVGDVLDMCERLQSSDGMPVTSKMMKKLQHYLPFMLEGVCYNQVLANNILLPQYKGGTNTYEYFLEIDRLDNLYDPKPMGGRPKCGRWLRSSARFLVCWVAEELKHEYSIGTGWHEVFDVTPEKRAPTTKRSHTIMVEEAPPTAPPPQPPSPTSSSSSDPPLAPIFRNVPDAESARSHSSVVTFGHLYCFNTMANPRLYKAGMTLNEDINVRLKQGYQGGNKPNIVVSTMFVLDPVSAEKRLMSALCNSGILTQDRRMGREWFFATDDDEVRRHATIARIMGRVALEIR